MSFRIAIVGSGAIGSYYGAKLAYSGSDVHFLMRGDLSEVRRAGLCILGPGENFRLAEVNCYSSTKEIGPCDLVLIAVKVTSNPDLVDLVPPLLHSRTMLLTMQNGLGNEEFLADYFGTERALVENLALERWRKLVWNVPFNGLSILAGGIDTAAILKDKDLRRTTLGLMDEVIETANKCGYSLEHAAATQQMKRTEKMGAYKPSTLLDWEAGRPLEIEPIWGEPLRRATTVGANVPHLEIVYALLKYLGGTVHGKKSAAKIASHSS